MKRMLLITAGVLIIAVAFLIWDAALLRNVAQTARDLQSGSEDTMSGNTVTDNTVAGTTGGPAEDVAAEGSEQSQEDNDTRTVIRSESVSVTGNTPEYDMRITLYEASDLKTYLRMEYFLNGMGIENELGEEQLPEIAGILESTSGQQDDINAKQIQQSLLNPVYGQLYLLIHGGPAGEYPQTSFYRIDLSDKKVHKLFTYPGMYGKMLFNRDFSLLAYSFDDPPVMSVYQEDKLLEVYDCKNGEYIVRGNKVQDGQPIGINHSKGYLYDYEFAAWESLSVVRLKQGIRKMTDLNVEPVVSEILYDVRKNMLKSSDGGVWQIAPDAEKAVDGAGTMLNGSGEAAGQDESAGATDADAGADTDGSATGDQIAKNDPTVSDPAMVLKSFYTYLQSEADYEKAMQLLDDKFKLRMAMLKQFGVPEISKSDIDAEYNQDSVLLYKDLLKAAKLDTISKETRIDDNTVIITYYQYLGVSSDSQVQQLMSAKLVKVNKKYKIVLIEDGVQ